MAEVIAVSGLLLVVIGPLVGRVVGWYAARQVRVPWGHIRDWMPSIPNNAVLDANAEERWEKRTRALEAKALRVIAEEPTGVTAAKLAPNVGEDVAVVSAVLERIREEIPNRLRVTRGGALIHDFEIEDVKTLQRKQLLKGPARLGVFVLSILANIGATWPMMMSVLVGVGALGAMAVVPEPLIVGIAGLLAIMGLLLVNVVGGWFIHLIMTPIGGPKIGPVDEAEDADTLVEETHAVRESMRKGSWSGPDVLILPDTGGCGGGCADIDIDGGFDADIGEGILVVLVAALLAAAVAACTFAIGIWVRGIWRATQKIGVPDPILSPAGWIRGNPPVDWIERFIPTNDLVLRITRTMKKILRRTHPEDGSMVKRILARAATQDGRIGALEIMLQEGVDDDEAMTIGAQLTGYFGGEIHVGDHGEIEFVFPEESHLTGEWEERDMHAEYLDFEPSGKINRRRAQKAKKLPVNIPGLSYGHLVGTDRLVAGTILMQMCAVALVHLVPDVPTLVQYGVDLVFPLMTLGAFALTGTARYISEAMAEHGVMRDVRRAGFIALKKALRDGEQTVNFEHLAGNVWFELKSAWRGFSRKDAYAELKSIAIELDLEPTAVDGEFDITPLRARLEGLEDQRKKPVVLGLEVEGADEVIFDTQVDHARVYALG